MTKKHKIKIINLKHRAVPMTPANEAAYARRQGRGIKVWVVDDDSSNAYYKQRDVLTVYPEARVGLFDSIFSAAQSPSGCDLCVIDLSAIAPIISGPNFFYSPICRFHELHPGAVIIICSGTSKEFMEEVATMVKERCPDTVIHVAEFARSQPLLDKLKEIENALYRTNTTPTV